MGDFDNGMSLKDVLGVLDLRVVNQSSKLRKFGFMYIGYTLKFKSRPSFARRSSKYMTCESKSACWVLIWIWQCMPYTLVELGWHYCRSEIENSFYGSRNKSNDILYKYFISFFLSSEILPAFLCIEIFNIQDTV